MDSIAGMYERTRMDSCIRQSSLGSLWRRNMAQRTPEPMNRRQLVRGGALAIGGLALHGSRMLLGQELKPLEVASAGSIRAMLDGPLKTAAAASLHVDVRSHSGGADAVARSVADGSLQADVFLPITATPMRTVMQSGKATAAYPVARTEMVLLYSPKSRFAAQFAALAEGRGKWWEVLQEPGMRIARSNPKDDPSGRCILFTMMLAAKKYNVSDLVEKVLGSPLNPAQVQPGVNVRAGLEDGSIDVMGGYRIAIGAGKLPFVALPAEVNLSDVQLGEKHPEMVLSVGEQTFRPEPLVFYAAALRGGSNADDANRFVEWIQGESARDLFRANGFSPADGVGRLEKVRVA